MNCIDRPWEDSEYVPTKAEAREWSTRRLAQEQYDWGVIAEAFHPHGEILSQEGCDVIVEELYSCSITFTWPDGQSITYTPEQR